MFDKQAYMKTYNREHYAQQKEWREQHRERRLIQQKAWRQEHPERTLAWRERFKINHPDYHAIKRRQFKERIDNYNHNYNEENPEKRKAEKKAQCQPLGKECEICGSIRNLTRHHPDYSEPLFCVTLCSSCHKYLHTIEVQVP